MIPWLPRPEDQTAGERSEQLRRIGTYLNGLACMHHEDKRFWQTYLTPANAAVLTLNLQYEAFCQLTADGQLVDINEAGLWNRLHRTKAAGYAAQAILADTVEEHERLMDRAAHHAQCCGRPVTEDDDDVVAAVAAYQAEDRLNAEIEAAEDTPESRCPPRE